MEAILVVNAGSSSLKFQLFEAAPGMRRLLKGHIDGIGTQPSFHAERADKSSIAKEVYPAHVVADLPAAMHHAAGWLRETQQVTLLAVGHRVVHGGPEYDRPVVVDNKVLADLDKLSALAPLHQPSNLAPIRSLLKHNPGLTQVACFDTAFHRAHSPVAEHYAIPEHFFDEGIRRYGFHGLSYQYISEQLHQIAPTIAEARVIVAHLGSGASMCAMLNGRSVESTLGFTALDGLPMGTRSGQIDPGVLLYLIMQRGMAPSEVQDLLYRQSGLKGLSGISNDVRVLERAEDPRAAFALEHFVYRVGMYAGMLAATLGGLDAFVFTGGIGENSVRIRERIAKGLAWLGARLDRKANKANARFISGKRSRVALYVIPTDEESIIARSTLSLVPSLESPVTAIGPKKLVS